MVIFGALNYGNIESPMASFSVTSVVGSLEVE